MFGLIDLTFMVIWALICGVIAEKLVGSGPGGILGSIVVGFMGSLVGRFLFPGFIIRHGFLGTILGAVIFLVIWKALARK